MPRPLRSLRVYLVDALVLVPEKSVRRHCPPAYFYGKVRFQLKASDKGAAEVRAAERPYGNLPLIVLTDSESGDIDNTGPVSVAAQCEGWVAKDKAEERVAELSTVGAHFVVAGSPHAIQLYHPSVVISAIDEVIAQARYNGKLP